ncbi:MAG: hypothetical protein M3025_05390 [Actinomycetota bacterium]|nr:hypothetical protein [Actinomycetota bacterium]
MRSSVSEILTEQTLGRGLRLLFGAYTDWELLDTLEVLAPERYEDLRPRPASSMKRSSTTAPGRCCVAMPRTKRSRVIETEPVTVSVAARSERRRAALGLAVP